MNFQLAAIGHSFKGSMAYYLHDKGLDAAGQHLATSERVAWTENRNLMTDGAHTATRIMIATAQSADMLKAAAGIKNTGRKATAGPVFAFSMQWQPNEVEGLDRAEMTRVADEAIKILGLSHLQAVLIAHTDTKHPHVHVVVNRVDPATGKMEPIREPAVHKLNRWADRYERENGKIVSPNRAQKYDEIDRKREQYPDADERKRYIQARDEARKTAGATSPAQMLKELGAAQKVAHGQQWVDLSAQHKAAKEAIYTTYGAKIAGAFDNHKAATKPEWAQHFRDARAREKAFEIREQHFAGRIRNALDAVTHQQITGQAGDKGRLSLTFNNVLSSQARRAAFVEQQSMSRGEFNKAMRDRLDGQTTALKAERAAALSKLRDTFAADRAALIQKQDSERAKIREAWAQLKNRTPPRTQTRDDAARSESATPKKAGASRYRQEREEARTVAVTRSRTLRQQQEKAAMKDAYDRNRTPQKAAPVQPTRTVNLSTPSPAPSPAGVTRPADRRPASVPAVDRAAAWAKTPEGQKVMRQQAPPSVPAVKKDWSKTASPAAAAPAPKKDWSRSAGTPAPAQASREQQLAPRKDWSAAANDKPREIKPLPPRDKSRDYDRER